MPDPFCPALDPPALCDLIFRDPVSGFPLVMAEPANDCALFGSICKDAPPTKRSASGNAEGSNSFQRLCVAGEHAAETPLHPQHHIFDMLEFINGYFNRAKNALSRSHSVVARPSSILCVPAKPNLQLFFCLSCDAYTFASCQCQYEWRNKPFKAHPAAPQYRIWRPRSRQHYSGDHTR